MKVYAIIPVNIAPKEVYRSENNAKARAAFLNERDSNLYEVVEIDILEDVVSSEYTYADALKAKIKASDEAARLAVEAFTIASKEIFEKYPNVDSFSFRAYTPSFNDGDPCFYQVSADEPDINGLGAGEEDSDGIYIFEKFKDSSREIAKMVYSFDENDIYKMFGDGVKVIVSYDRVTKKIIFDKRDYEGC